MNEFKFLSYAQQVVFGAGSISKLSEAADQYGWQRLMLCTSGAARRDGLVDIIQAALGARLAVTYDHVQPHVQDFQVDEILSIAADHNVDAIIGLGGGSPIGMAKAVSLALEKNRRGKAGADALPTSQPLIPVIAIPTTYAGSEMTPVVGVTQHSDGTARKVTVSDPRIIPKLAIYDPQLTITLPPEMTGSTGINALAHCVEAVYSITRNPLSTAAALAGARQIAHALTRCFAHGDDLDARAEMLEGAYLAGYALANVAMGLHHGICHVLGGSAGVPHGIANSVMLPHVMRFNIDVTTHELAEIGVAIGLDSAGRDDKALAEAAAQRVSDMVGEMKLPQRLRDAGVQESDIPRLAQIGAASRTIKNNPKPIDAAQIESLLRAAW